MRRRVKLTINEISFCTYQPEVYVRKILAGKRWLKNLGNKFLRSRSIHRKASYKMAVALINDNQNILSDKTESIHDRSLVCCNMMAIEKTHGISYQTIQK